MIRLACDRATTSLLYVYRPTEHDSDLLAARVGDGLDWPRLEEHTYCTVPLPCRHVLIGTAPSAASQRGKALRIWISWRCGGRSPALVRRAGTRQAPPGRQAGGAAAVETLLTSFGAGEQRSFRASRGARAWLRATSGCKHPGSKASNHPGNRRSMHQISHPTFQIFRVTRIGMHTDSNKGMI